MRILLVGEYSRLHNSLKEGLQALGHDVTLVGSGDAFKNYPVDLLLERGFEKGWRKKLKIAIHKLISVDISAIALRRKFNKLKSQLQGYNVVQLINESSFLTTPKLELEIAAFLKKHNNKLFLLSCGADYKSIAYTDSGQLPYSILTPYKEGKGTAKDYENSLKFKTPAFKELHKKLYKLVDGIIATDLDYHLPYKDDNNYLGLIPNPINIDAIPYNPLDVETKIVVFQGINSTNYFAKGQDVFTEAIDLVKKEIPHQVEIICTTDLPYKEYMRAYNRAHIILDQVYSLDQGYNALEAMTRGKVVFTGAGKEFISNYNLRETVAIDAIPSAKHIAENIIELVNDPKSLEEISRSARNFILEHHDYKKVAQQYIDTWNK